MDIFNYEMIKRFGQHNDDEFGQLCNKIAEVYEKFGEVKADEFYRKIVDLIEVEERYMKNDVKKNSLKDIFE